MDKNCKPAGTAKTPMETGHSEPKMSPKLLEMLVCPVTHGPLEYNEKSQELISRKAGLAFPIRDGIPIMLAEEARPLDPEGSK
jgi:uncharacterized protein YbaR (Trm112 family)